MDMIAMIVFLVLVTGALIIDLKIVGGKERAPTMREALIWTFVFVGIAVSFGIFLYFEEGSRQASEYFTAYAIEKTLSVDNLFVFILVFSYFKVPDKYHHKILFYGILGAFVLRAIFIYLGATFIEYTYFDILGYKINFVLTAFGGILIWKGYGAFMEAISNDDGEDEDFSNSPGARFVKWVTRGKVLTRYFGDAFFISQWDKDKRMFVSYGTLLLIVVGVIEFTDVVFAVDSIPAIFSVTQNKFILYTSNIFAILGLRSMYFLLAGMLPLFRYLGYGLAFILVFIGFKMVAAPWIHISGPLSLYIVLGVLTLSITLSFIIPAPIINEEE